MLGEIASPARTSRLAREIQLLDRDGMREGIQWINREQFIQGIDLALLVNIAGPIGSPYEGNSYQLQITFPSQFPFEPPHVKFDSMNGNHHITIPYHPNIDGEGRICLDLLKMPPAGTWRPTVTIVSVITAIRVLLAEPNPDDPLVPEIAREYICDRPLYWQKAANTIKYSDGTSQVSNKQPEAIQDTIHQTLNDQNEPSSLLSRKKRNTNSLPCPPCL